MLGHNAMLETVCATYAALVRPCEQFRDQCIADAWRDFDIRMTIAARKAHEIGDWRQHEKEWTVAQEARAALTSAAWEDYRAATGATNAWFQSRLARAVAGRRV